MHGQYIGQVMDEEGNPFGHAQLLFDCNKTGGQLIYAAQERRSAVACEHKYLPDKTIALKLTKSDILENCYSVPKEGRVAEDFEGFAELKATDSGQWSGQWSIGTASGSIRLHATHGRDPRKSTLELRSWDKFTEWARKTRSEGRSLFRGQSHKHALRTTFHRTGRVDLIRYMKEDLPTFNDHLTTVHGRGYDISSPSTRGSVMGIAQHHGFPTPLLDWTLSPYVAAYFAFSGAVESSDRPGKVRIFRLRPTYLKKYSAGENPMMPWDTNLKLVEFRPESGGNTRLLGQQGTFTFSNINDIEGLIQIHEKADNTVYLDIIDMPVSLARRALTELRFMGTSAATLFPGLDGAAVHLKHELYYHDQHS